MTFSGGTSVAEYGITPTLELGPVQVMYVRGGDMGGGVGGLLYSLRPASTGALPTVAGYKHFNARGDVLAQSNAAGQVTWAGGYESGGKRLVEKGTMSDRQKANTKEEDPSGLLNEGFRYRDMEIGMFISRDPAGFVDGPNVYTYVVQNPWSAFDAEGLFFKYLQEKTVSLTGWVMDKTGLTDTITNAIVDNGYGEALVEADNKYNIGGKLEAAKNTVGEVGEFFAPVSSEALVAAENRQFGKLAEEVLRSKFKIVDKALTLVETGEAVASGDVVTVAANMMPSGGKKHSGGTGGGGGPSPGGPSAKACVFDPTTCFPAGTAVARSDGPAAIETIGVGDCVVVPEEFAMASQRMDRVEPDGTWREVRLELTVPEYPQDPYAIVLLRPAAWVAERKCGEPGSRVWLEFEEMGVRGMARVLSVRPHPGPRPGGGQVVTGTFTHRNPDLHELRLGDGRVLEATGRHPLWSLTRGTWVRTSELEAGERLATREGGVTILAVTPVPGVHRVYNLEVPGAHCYYAGASAVLAHNDCASGTHTSSTGGSALTNGDFTAADVAPTRMPALPAGEAPYQLKLFPDEAYSRTGHYGSTPTAAQRASVPPGMEFDHNPTLVEHYYKGDGNGGLPGFNLTQTERLQHARSLSSGSAATPAQQRAQGGAAAQFSKEQKKQNGL